MSIYNLFWTGDEAAEAWVTFVSYQDPQYGTDGQSCSVWDLTYDLVLENDGWKFDRPETSRARRPPADFTRAPRSVSLDAFRSRGSIHRDRVARQ